MLNVAVGAVWCMKLAGLSLHRCYAYRCSVCSRSYSGDMAGRLISSAAMLGFSGVMAALLRRSALLVAATAKPTSLGAGVSGTVGWSWHCRCHRVDITLCRGYGQIEAFTKQTMTVAPSGGRRGSRREDDAALRDECGGHGGLRIRTVRNGAEEIFIAGGRSAQAARV